MAATEKVYVIREVNGTDYYSETRGFIPSSDAATEYETLAEAEASAEANCQSRDVKIFARDAE